MKKAFSDWLRGLAYTSGIIMAIELTPKITEKIIKKIKNNDVKNETEE